MLIKEVNVLEFDFCELNKFIKEFSEAKRSRELPNLLVVMLEAL